MVIHAATGSTAPDAVPYRNARLLDIPPARRGMEMMAPSGKFWRAIPRASASAPAAEVTMPTYPDAATVDLAAVEAQIKELAPKVKTVTDGKLVLGTSADYSPYEFHIYENGVDKIVGFDVALAQAIADELGVELEIHDIPFDSILMELNMGSVDIGIAGFTPTPARLEAIDVMLELSEGAPQEFTVKVDSPRLLCFTLGVDKLKLFSVAMLSHVSDTQLLHRERSERIVWISDSGTPLEGLTLPPKHFFAARQADGSHRFYGSNGP